MKLEVVQRSDRYPDSEPIHIAEVGEGLHSTFGDGVRIGVDWNETRATAWLRVANIPLGDDTETSA